MGPDRALFVTPDMVRNGETAVVLSGGGAHGAFEVGVLNALYSGKCPVTQNGPLNASIFTGSSVGSFNAAVMCMEPGVDGAVTAGRLREIWTRDVADGASGAGSGVYRVRGNPLRYLGLSGRAGPISVLETARDATYLTEDLIRRVGQVASSTGSLPRRLLTLLDLSVFFSVEPFGRLLEKRLNLHGIRTSDKQLKIIATNWRTGELRVFSNADMTDALGRSIVMGSSAIPGLFPAVHIGSDIYVDGGVVMNTPLSAALEAGASELHVVYLDPDISDVPLKPSPDTVDTFERVYTILLATKIDEDIATARWVNEGLEVLDKAKAGHALNRVNDRAFVRVASQIARRTREGHPYKKLTIHRYHPRRDLGGSLGMLDFNQRTIEKVIEQGYENAMRHDCRTSRCLLPAESSKTF